MTVTKKSQGSHRIDRRSQLISLTLSRGVSEPDRTNLRNELVGRNDTFGSGAPWYLGRALEHNTDSVADTTPHVLRSTEEQNTKDIINVNLNVNVKHKRNEDDVQSRIRETRKTS